MNETREARKESVSEDCGKLGLVLSAVGTDSDDARMVSGLTWQTQTPQEQWETMFGQKDR